MMAMLALHFHALSIPKKTSERRNNGMTHTHAIPRRPATAALVRRFICRLRTRIIGSKATVRSKSADDALNMYNVIAIASTYPQCPSVSPLIRVHQNETGEHCMTKRTKKGIKLQTARAVTV
jgi:hypothetical protein